MKLQRCLCLFLLTCIISIKIFAQEKSFAFNLVSGSKDVSLGKINGITQDTYGYMWFADPGNNQLIRYDGYRMKVFKHTADTNSINRSSFECIAADSSGNIWLPVYTGIDKINSATGIVKHYKLKIPIGDAIIVDHLGIIWVGGGGSGGLYQFNTKTGKVIYYFHNDKDSTTISSNIVRVLYEDKEGTIWAGCGYPFVPGDDGGLNKLNRSTGKFTRYMNNPADPHSIINNRVRSILEDSRGTFWIGTQGDGLHILDRKTGKFERLTYDANHPEKLSRPPLKKTDFADHITFIKEDISGNIWIGTYKEGIEEYNPLTKKIIHFLKDTTSVNGFADSTTWTAFSSRDGTLWVSTETSNLLYRVDAFRKSLKYVATGAQASGFAEDKNGYLWVGTGGNGILKFDEQYNVIAHLIHNPSDSLSLPDNNNMLSAALHDKIWVPCYIGMRLLNEQTGKLNKLNIDNYLFKDSVHHGFVSALEDKEGALWFATWGQGLLMYNPKYNSSKQYLPKDSNAVASIDLNHLLEDKQGRLWVTGGGGISRIDRKTEKFKNYLTDAFIGSIYQDSKNNIWAGTSRGLYRYNEKDDSFFPFFDPLTDIYTTPVGGLVEDNEHNLWMKSNSSIIKLNPVTKAFFVYGEKFGIGKTSMDIWTYSYKNKKGQLLFGNNDGFLIFYPHELDIKESFKIFLTGFYVNNILVLPGSSILKKPVEEINNVNLKYNQNNITLDFSAMDYRDPEGISYFTMLEGYDNTWRKVTGEKSSGYFNLPHGRFIYHIKAFNKDQARAEKTLIIIINPPWWQTWWAYTLYVVLLIAIIWSYTKWRTKALEKEKINLEKKVTERTQELKQEKEIVESTLVELKSTQAQLIQSEKMASLGELTAGIAHEIQNPLNFVNNFSEVNNELIEEMDSESDVKEIKAIANDIKQNNEKILFHGRRADSIVKGMLQHSRKSTGLKEPTDINALCDEYLRLSYHGLRAKDKSFNADFKTDFDASIDKINIVPQDIGRVLLNLFNNAFYAVNERLTAHRSPLTDDYKPLVSVQTKKINTKIEIKVSDNGNGIPQNIIDKIFQPFFTTKPTGQGTGLGLSLAYDIITKEHGGTIKVESKEGEGSEFLIQLPINA